MARLALRPKEFNARAAALGLESQSAQARAIRVAPSIHNRALAGLRGLNGPYVVGVLWLVGDDVVRAHLKALFDFDFDALEQAAS